jgi:GntR family transcriptional regulator
MKDIQRPEFLTVTECATALRVAKATIYRLVGTGDLSAVKVNGRTIRIYAESWREYLENNRTGETGDGEGVPEQRAYMRLAALIRDQIASGALAPGDRIPIGAHRDKTGYSRQTVGKAIAILEREGLVYRVTGLGYHVS